MGTGHSKKTFLQQHTIADVLIEEPQTLLMIDSKHSVGEALALLDDHKPPLISAPLFSKEHQMDVGIFDVQDAVALLYNKAENLLEIGDLEGFKKVWFDSPAFDAVESGGGDNVLPVKMTDSLEHVINHMVSIDSHRCALQDTKGNMRSLIAQSVMIKYLARHREQLLLNNQGDKSVRELNLGFVRHMIYVRASDPVYAGFALMGKHQISSVIVVDDRGRMVNSLSASNIRHIKRSAMEDLMLPTAAFLEKYNLRQMNSITPGTSFSAMVNLMAADHGLHRVFILGENAKCLGVIALTDVLHEFYNQVEHPSEGPRRYPVESNKIESSEMETGKPLT